MPHPVGDHRIDQQPVGDRHARYVVNDTRSAIAPETMVAEVPAKPSWKRKKVQPRPLPGGRRRSLAEEQVAADPAAGAVRRRPGRSRRPARTTRRSRPVDHVLHRGRPTLRGRTNPTSRQRNPPCMRKEARWRRGSRASRRSWARSGYPLMRSLSVPWGRALSAEGRSADRRAARTTPTPPSRSSRGCAADPRRCP